MTANSKTFSYALVAAASNGISTAQSLGGAGNLTITGSLATGGVATMDVARRVVIASVGNDSALTWTITGTDRYGRVQSEALAGSNAGTSQSIKDYKTVTQIAGSGATAGNVTAGTNGVGSSDVFVVNYLANPFTLSAALVFTGVANATVELSFDDIAPDYNTNANPPTWFSALNLTSVATNSASAITGPVALARTTINSGTGSVKTIFTQGLGPTA